MIAFIMRLKSRAHFTIGPQPGLRDATFLGTNARRRKQARQRLAILIGLFLAAYLALGARLLQYGLTEPLQSAAIDASAHAVASRPDLTDRNGLLLATDLNTVSLYAEPRRILDADEVVEKLALVVPNLDWRETHRKLHSNSAFQWLRRQLTPKQQAEILALGLPGIGFRPEKRRFYPGGVTAAHIVGHVNVDNQGLAGIDDALRNNDLQVRKAAKISLQIPVLGLRVNPDAFLHLVQQALAAQQDPAA